MPLESIEIFSEISLLSVIFRLFLAFIMGGLLGIERERKRRPAGFRTYIIVCVGSSLASITNVYLYQTMGNTDVTRLPAQVISGIGFLGAGTILITKHNRIKGLTTAAGLWCAAIVGLAVGSGFYAGAIATCVIIVIAFNFLTYVDNKFAIRNRYIGIYVEYYDSEFVKNFISYVRKNQFEMRDLEIYPAKNEVSGCITCYVIISRDSNRSQIIEELWKIDGLLYMEEVNE